MRHYASVLRAVLTAVLMLVVIKGAGAGPLEDGLAAFDKGDYATALRLLRPLAEQGDAVAQFNLGLIYQDGQGVPQDYTEAVRWFRLAAEQGEPDAQGCLGFLYAEGLGVPQDYVQAHMWLNLAASRYPASRKEVRDRAAKGRDLVAAEMTPAQIAEAQKLAREWKPKLER